MKLLDRLVLRQLVVLFFSSLFMFVSLIEIIDLFSNLARYQNNAVGIKQILIVQLYYLPKAISFSLPIACLFSTVLAIGNFYASNELIVVFSSGISLFRFTFPLLLLGLLLSIGSFYFEEKIVIPTYRQKALLSEQLLQGGRNFNTYNVAVRRYGGQRIYYVDKYEDQEKYLRRIIVVDFNDKKDTVIRRIDAERAQWIDGQWQFSDVVIYTRNSKGLFDVSQLADFTEKSFTAPPTVFQSSDRDIEEMPIKDAREWLAILQESGADYKKTLAIYYSRFSFAYTPFIVILISCSMGGRLRKNIVLMSLLFALLITVSYYIIRSIGVILAANGSISPATAAWFATIFFLLLGVILFALAPT